MVATLAAALTCGLSLRAATLPAVPLTADTSASQSELSPTAFAGSAEAEMLHKAYHILATGDHDYKGHRVRAMRAVEAAGKLLGLNLRGDDKDKEKQAISDEKLREAQGLISQVLASAEVQHQKAVVKHLNTANEQINTALSIR
jgi:hypothetical protein